MCVEVGRVGDYGIDIVKRVRFLFLYCCFVFGGFFWIVYFVYSGMLISCTLIIKRR